MGELCRYHYQVIYGRRSVPTPSPQQPCPPRLGLAILVTTHTQNGARIDEFTEDMIDGRFSNLTNAK